MQYWQTLNSLAPNIKVLCETLSIFFQCSDWSIPLSILVHEIDLVWVWWVHQSEIDSRCYVIWYWYKFLSVIEHSNSQDQLQYWFKHCMQWRESCWNGKTVVKHCIYCQLRISNVFCTDYTCYIVLSNIHPFFWSLSA